MAAVLAAVSSAGTITIAVSVAVESFWIENFWIREVDVGPDGKIRYEDFIARMVAKFELIEFISLLCISSHSHSPAIFSSMLSLFFENLNWSDPVFIPVPDNSANKRRFTLSCP
ncbi:hypothetical protein Ahy_B03g065537 [Arachis hypogaea]|uniref:EF-hand domain-containing protein n=1 Tax=Arachis hypogaea TaxID=3818 RepID=A0A445A225_ARAHY|nr:hypothetical protein Ahy_B03g065537 [Arachis hypogaea]